MKTDYKDLVTKLRNRRVCIQSGGDLEKDFPLMREAADVIEELILELAETSNEMQRQMCRADGGQWISVDKELPKSMTSVLLTVKRVGKGFNHTPFISTGYLCTDGCSWWCSHDGLCSLAEVEVTHWMNSPEIPREALPVMYYPQVSGITPTLIKEEE